MTNTTHTTRIATLSETYPDQTVNEGADRVRWVCDTKGCTSLGGYWTTDEAKARRGAAAHRNRMSPGPKALKSRLTLEW